MFRNRKYYNVDFTELNRRLRRLFDGNFSYRKLLLFVFAIAIVVLYIGPYVFSWLFGVAKETKGTYEANDIKENVSDIGLRRHHMQMHAYTTRLM